jgi:hypothetical protein
VFVTDSTEKHAFGKVVGKLTDTGFDAVENVPH